MPSPRIARSPTDDHACGAHGARRFATDAHVDGIGEADDEPRGGPWRAAERTVAELSVVILAPAPHVAADTGARRTVARADLVDAGGRRQQQRMQADEMRSISELPACVPSPAGDRTGHRHCAPVVPPENRCRKRSPGACRAHRRTPARSSTRCRSSRSSSRSCARPSRTECSDRHRTRRTLGRRRWERRTSGDTRRADGARARRGSVVHDAVAVVVHTVANLWLRRVHRRIRVVTVVAAKRMAGRRRASHHRRARSEPVHVLVRVERAGDVLVDREITVLNPPVAQLGRARMASRVCVIAIRSATGAVATGHVDVSVGVVIARTDSAGIAVLVVPRCVA